MSKSDHHKEDLTDVIYSLLTKYTSTVRSTAEGWEILCPFHRDTNPSCNVYHSGIFYCWRCGTKTPKEGFKALKVPDSIIEQHWGKKKKTSDVSKLPKLPSLLDVFNEKNIKTEKELKQPFFYVKDREPWPENWSFRGLPSAFLTSKNSIVHKLFEPNLVRLSLKKKTKYLPERFPRMALKFYGTEHEVYLRTSHKQELRNINSPNINFKNLDLLPFGLDSWELGEAHGIILVEGAFDVLNTLWNLYQMDKGKGNWLRAFKVVALMSVTQWPAFAKKFEFKFLPYFSDKCLILALDNDSAGKETTKKILKEVERKNWLPPQQIKSLTYDTKDMGALPFLGFKEAMHSID